MDICHFILRYITWFWRNCCRWVFTVIYTSSFPVLSLVCIHLAKQQVFKISVVSLEHFSGAHGAWTSLSFSSQGFSWRPSNWFHASQENPRVGLMVVHWCSMNFGAPIISSEWILHDAISFFRTSLVERSSIYFLFVSLPRHWTCRAEALLEEILISEERPVWIGFWIFPWFRRARFREGMTGSVRDGRPGEGWPAQWRITGPSRSWEWANSRRWVFR